MVVTRVRGEQPLHPASDVATAAWPQHEMQVIRHEANCEYRNLDTQLRLRDQIQKRGVVSRLVEDLRLAICAIQNVVTLAGVDLAGKVAACAEANMRGSCREFVNRAASTSFSLFEAWQLSGLAPFASKWGLTPFILARA